MSDRYKNKLRIESIRWNNWDYSSNGFYFLTICTKDRANIFGKIENGEMILNEFGEIVKSEWFKSGQIRKEIIIDEFIVMPDHIHGIVIIKNEIVQNGNLNDMTKRELPHMKPKSISSFVAGFKSSVTKKINQLRNTPNKIIWQTGFYDRVIRNEIEYNNIKNYIINNPINWEK
jgi:putative transposase